MGKNSRQFEENNPTEPKVQFYETIKTQADSPFYSLQDVLKFVEVLVIVFAQTNSEIAKNVNRIVGLQIKNEKNRFTVTEDQFHK